MPTKKQILEELIDLEKDYHLLSGDSVWQEQLFEIQPKICDLMCKIANETGYDLAAEIPYLFKNESKNGS